MLFSLGKQCFSVFTSTFQNFQRCMWACDKRHSQHFDISPEFKTWIWLIFFSTLNESLVLYVWEKLHWNITVAGLVCQYLHTGVQLLIIVCQWSRAPSDAQFACLWHTRTSFHPLQVYPVHGVDPLNLLVRGVFTL